MSPILAAHDAQHQHWASGHMHVAMPACEQQLQIQMDVQQSVWRCDSSPVEVTLLVDFRKVYTQALLIARHGDFKHPGGRVQPLGGPLDPGDCLIVGNQVT